MTKPLTPEEPSLQKKLKPATKPHADMKMGKASHKQPKQPKQRIIRHQGR